MVDLVVRNMAPKTVLERLRPIQLRILSRIHQRVHDCHRHCEPYLAKMEMLPLIHSDSPTSRTIRDLMFPRPRRRHRGRIAWLPANSLTLQMWKMHTPFVRRISFSPLVHKFRGCVPNYPRTYQGLKTSLRRHRRKSYDCYP